MHTARPILLDLADRPDIRETTDSAALALREALSGWFGTPLDTTVPIIDQSC